MFHQIKARIQTVRQDLTDSIKTFAFGEGGKREYRPSRQQKCDLGAGFKLLHHNENLWKEIHYNSEQNAKKADESDKVIADIRDIVEKKLQEMKQLNYEVCMLPQLTNGIQEMMGQIGDIEGLFEDVHSSVVNLENLINEGKMQEQKLEERFRLAMFKERKLAEFETYKFQLHCQYKEKSRDQEIKHRELLEERQAIFKEAFEEEMQNYKTKGQLNCIVHTSSTHPSLDLADITLEEDQNVLDEFLADTTSDLDINSRNEDSSEGENVEALNETTK